MDNLIEETAKKHEINPKLLKDLISMEQEKVHLERRRNVGKQIREIIEKYIEKR